ncbi:MAG: hypothetical protein LBG78_07945 [Azoarcus sp.]|jgi:hypothetical protein|nr:hypothetical protein [Azoarcus sp.]
MKWLLVLAGAGFILYSFLNDAVSGTLTFSKVLPFCILVLALAWRKEINQKLINWTKALEQKAEKLEDENAGKPPPSEGAAGTDGITVRCTTPDGETGTVVHVADGIAHVSFDAKTPEEEARLRFQGDPAQTGIVLKLLQVPAEQRDEQWNESFLAHIADANLTCDIEKQPFDGPDGFPYFKLLPPKKGERYQAWVIRHILPNLLDHGYGVAINPEKAIPDWIFSYGDIVCFHVYGKFMVRDDDRFDAYTEEDDGSSDDIPDEGMQVQMGDPSPQILPPPARAMLRRFLEAYGLPAKIMLMNRPAGKGRKGGLSLVFPFTEQASDETMQYVTRAVPWFLPRHYPVVWMQDSENFTSL